jgi:hypothetical protein
MSTKMNRWMLVLSAVLAAVSLPALSWASLTINHNETLVRDE